MSATWSIIPGDCRATLATLNAGSVQTCVTSPPYFGLRDYGHDGQIGLEPTPDEFVAALVEVFREVRRVLRNDGTVWLNLGDSYAGSDKMGRADAASLAAIPVARGAGGTMVPSGGQSGKAAERRCAPRMTEGCKPKDLLGIPWMVAFALRADGWYLRSDIIWSKPNPMPESVTDRPTKAHEYLFLLSKSPRYAYDADAIREPFDPDTPRARYGGLMPSERRGEAHLQPNAQAKIATGDWVGFSPGEPNPLGRNKRSVWTVATQPYPGAHFATFPPKLIEPCILAGCPERACGECGAPWERIVEREGTGRVYERGATPADHRSLGAAQHTGSGSGALSVATRTLGFVPSCDHNAPAVPGVVLDPFAGAGTTGMVALRHDRSFIGCELSPEYVALARDRIIADSPLLNTHAEAA